MNKILLIEDSPTMRTLLQTLLELEGFEVLISNAMKEEDILREIAEKQPKVILLDVHLRGINGIKLLERMREEQPVPELRVLMTSGMDLRDECIKAGADGFILKPYMPDELFAYLKKFIETGK
ncbi:MAG: response regulator [Anaerolineales bacterium]